MADEPQVGQQHKDVERNWEYYHIIIFPEWTYVTEENGEDKMVRESN